ncbi:MAG: 30S ribosomal protein S6 [Deltaproteobacteria bacterium]|nr:30S ribosomal protein S6 [Deltaproteobacteria bacterium]
MSNYYEYETICVFTPDFQAESQKKTEDKINSIFANHKVTEITKKDWGNRKLAYPIKKFTTGHYIQYIHKSPGALVNDLEKNLGYDESVLRYLTVRFNKYSRKGVEVEPSGFEVNE